MANNLYGTVRQAQFNPSTDADIFYYYRPTRSSEDSSFTGFKKLDDASQMLRQSTVEQDVASNGSDLNLPGMYTLSLPVDIFSNVGIYTVYIVPKEIVCEIKDIGVLSSYPDISGIIIDTDNISTQYRDLFKHDNLTGYTIEYFGNNGVRQDYTRIITTSTSCETSQNGYRYNENGSLSFLTVTPSTAPSFKSNAVPYIGVPSQKIVIKNTKFDPICIEIEITNHDIETISYMLEGEQVRNYETGRVTTYNFDGDIYKQMEFSTVKDNYTNTNIAELKVDKSNNIDNSLDLNTLKR